MNNLIETMGIGGLQFELYKAIAYYMIAAVIKTTFAITTFYFVFLSIVRTCDENSSESKRQMFLGYAFVGIYGLVVFLGWGYNPILFLLIEVVTLRYWAKEEVAIKSILQAEWQEDWLPRLQQVANMFKTLTRH